MSWVLNGSWTKRFTVNRSGREISGAEHERGLAEFQLQHLDSEPHNTSAAFCCQESLGELLLGFFDLWGREALCLRFLWFAVDENLVVS